MSNKLIKPETSIIIPVFGRRNLVIKTLDSILTQKHIDKKKIEIIVVDDEDAKELVNDNRHFYKSLSPRIIYLENRYDEGPGGSRQTGLEAARGRFLTFLDSDDCLKPDFIRQMSDVLAKDDKFVGVISLSDAIFDKGFYLKERLKLIPLIFIRDTLLASSFFINKQTLFLGSFYLCQVSHMMFVRDMIRELKFNYEYRRGGEDWDFIYHCLKKGNIGILPRKLIFFRYSPNSLINKKINRELKWKSYRLLANRFSKETKVNIFYKMFLGYIYLFGSKYAKN